MYFYFKQIPVKRIPYENLVESFVAEQLQEREAEDKGGNQLGLERELLSGVSLDLVVDLGSQTEILLAPDELLDVFFDGVLVSFELHEKLEAVRVLGVLVDLAAGDQDHFQGELLVEVLQHLASLVEEMNGCDLAEALVFELELFFQTAGEVLVEDEEFVDRGGPVLLGGDADVQDLDLVLVLIMLAIDEEHVVLLELLLISELFLLGDYLVSGERVLEDEDLSQSRDIPRVHLFVLSLVSCLHLDLTCKLHYNFINSI